MTLSSGRSRLALAVAAASLLVASGCGSDDDGGGSDEAKDAPGAPAASAADDAATDDFCEAFNNGVPEGAESVGAEDYAEQVELLHTYAGRLSEVGTPEDMDDASRHGFEVLVDVYAGVDAEAMAEAASNPDFGVSEDDKADVEAFITYALGACGTGGVVPPETTP